MGDNQKKNCLTAKRCTERTEVKRKVMRKGTRNIV